MRVFQRGETIGLWAFLKNWEGTYVSPDNGVKITLVDPSGNPAEDADENDITDTSMGSPVETGKYAYYYLSKAADTVGWWRFQCRSQDGAGNVAKYTVTDGGFILR